MSLALIFILCTTYKLLAQPSQITGTITGEKGEALAGVTVKVKGTNAGTFTDANGSFTINADSKDVLLISYVGYSDIEMPVNAQQHMDIKLTLATKELNQVVVIGYGS